MSEQFDSGIEVRSGTVYILHEGNAVNTEVCVASEIDGQMMMLVDTAVNTKVIDHTVSDVEWAEERIEDIALGAQEFKKGLRRVIGVMGIISVASVTYACINSPNGNAGNLYFAPFVVAGVAIAGGAVLERAANRNAAEDIARAQQDLESVEQKSATIKAFFES